MAIEYPLLDFRSKGHARKHIAFCRETIGYFRAAIGKHGPHIGYVSSISVLLNEMNQGFAFLRGEHHTGSSFDD